MTPIMQAKKYQEPPQGVRKVVQLKDALAKTNPVPKLSEEQVENEKMLK